jgi:glycosidase
VKKEKWIRATMALTILIGLIAPLTTQAASRESIQDESIYDLLVDRYFNKTIENDFEVNTREPSAFAGGDFMGVVEKLDHIQEMGFSMVSLGPVFSTETYDGKRVLDYGQLERHFGTSEELKTLIDKASKKNIGVVVDFPLQQVSSKHIWATDQDKASWVISNENGTVSWDLTDKNAQQAVEKAALDFVKQYNVDGLRLTGIDGIDKAFLNSLIDKLKTENDKLYVLALESSDANFDAQVASGQEDMYRNIFKNVDLDTAKLPQFSTNQPVIQQIDSINTKRFTANAAEENMFPPTRWKMAMATLLSMPGIPVMTYGSEIAVNGDKPPASHPILDFNTDEELIEFIGDVHSLRNDSAALRTGKMDMLYNEAGLMVYERSNDEETWIVAINNTGGTQSFDIPREVIGDKKELRGLFEGDILRQRDDGNYRLVVDREIAEFYNVTNHKGINKGYLAALALVYILFMTFIYLVWRKGKQRKAEEMKNSR